VQEIAEELDDLKAENEELRAACKLPKKQKKQKQEPVYLTDEEREYIRLSDNLDAESRAWIEPHAQDIMRRYRGEK
jgi:hypothetical protein